MRQNVLVSHTPTCFICLMRPTINYYHDFILNAGLQYIDGTRTRSLKREYFGCKSTTDRPLWSSSKLFKIVENKNVKAGQEILLNAYFLTMQQACGFNSLASFPV
jgi:hypothetical protein